jgi:Fic-DOC domain mobile mystery protein B
MTGISGEPEGATPLDPDEIEGLRHRHVTTRQQLDALEQANIVTGLQWLHRRRKTDVLTDSFLRALHRRLFGEVWHWAGSYRLREKNIGVDPIQIPVQVRMLLDDVRYWEAQAVYPALEAAARFHHRLVKIHLFPNGNGRHARIAADVFLTERLGHPPIDWAAGADLQALSERRRAYIAALRAADGHDYGPLLAFVGA